MTTHRDFKTMVLSASEGQETSILEGVGATAQELSGKKFECRHCGQKARRNRPESLLCNGCSAASKDIFGSVAFLLGLDCKRDFPKVLTIVAEHLGISKPSEATKEKQRETIFADYAKLKGINEEQLRKTGAELSEYKGTVCLEVPMYGPDFEVIGCQYVSPYGSKKLNKGITKRGSKNGLFLLGTAKPVDGEIWHPVEGFKDACRLAAMGLNVVGICGVMSIQNYIGLFEGVNVVFIPDGDQPGIAMAYRNADLLLDTASSIKIAQLTDNVKPANGLDVRDFVKLKGEDYVRARIEAAVPFDPNTMTVRPELSCDVGVDEQTTAVLALTNLSMVGFEFGLECDRVYQKNGRLVTIEQVDGKTEIVPLQRPRIRAKLGSAIRFTQTTNFDDGQVKEIRPPSWLVELIEEMPDYPGIRRIEKVITTPGILPNGDLVQTRGYNSDARMYFDPDAHYEMVPDRPTQDDARQAAAVLLDITCDVPFGNPAGQSAWLASLLTVLFRHAISGCVPLFAIDATTPGVGKSLLVNLISLICFGRKQAMQTLPRCTKEQKKVFTSMIRKGKTMIAFDNLDSSSRIGGQEIDAIATAELWEDRILQTSETTGEMEQNLILFFTGNNLVFHGDSHRRTMLIRLVTELESPEHRSGFKHPNLLDYVERHRAELVVAALVLIRAFHVAGRPQPPKEKTLGSFEGWLSLIVGALCWVGLENPCETVAEVKEASSDGDELQLIIHCFGQINTATAAEILKAVQDENSGSAWEPVKALFGETSPGKLTAKRIGCKLRKYKGRVSNGQRLVSKKLPSNVLQWRVETVGPISTGEDITLNLSPEPEAEHGFCEDSECGEALTATEAHDGYMTIECRVCDRVYKTIKPEENNNEQTETIL